MNIKRPKGTKDILPVEIHKWHYIEKKISEITNLYNFKEIRTPTFEYTDLFKRGVGNETDIVGKEMYTFEDKSGNSITLRPEMTAPVIRAYLENALPSEGILHKLYYISSIYRYEKPQEGRYREHTQFGAELIGSDDVLTDIELIKIAVELFGSIGINDFKLKINSIGTLEERKRYINILKEYLQRYENELSEDSKRRLNSNTLRVLDSKNQSDKKITEEAPKIIDNLDNESKERFEKVLRGLEDTGIKYEIDFRLVRGIDYYTDTTFEFISDKLGGQDAICGGGRYDGLISTLGGKPTPGIGFGSGMERLILVAEKSGFDFTDTKYPLIYLISLSDNARQLRNKLVFDLRNKKIRTETDYLSKSFKAQMRDADKLGADHVLIIGDDEINEGTGIIKNMSDSSQVKIKFENITEYFINENKKSKTATE